MYIAKNSDAYELALSLEIVRKQMFAIETLLSETQPDELRVKLRLRFSDLANDERDLINALTVH